MFKHNAHHLNVVLNLIRFRFETGSHCYINNDQIWCENDWNELKHRILGLSAASESDVVGSSSATSQLNNCVSDEYLTTPLLVGIPVDGGLDGAESMGDDASSGYGSPSPDTSTGRRLL